ncbi:MAG TPA: xanthine dehydrogenase family protein subunit M [Caldimonas sp.]|jgi:carbon-monoxide dehydrogenase medium subunit
MYAFDYQRPATRDAAKSAASGGDVRYLAGGQSLIQAMRLRLSQSARLVDLGGVADLRQIRAENNGVTIGAMATHASVARNADVKRIAPAIAELAGGIGDPMVRNMGTIGGSIANADPAACYPAGVLAFNATIQTDRRTIAADDFFTGLWETALQAGELITAVAFPQVQKAAYVKYRQPASRFALIGVCIAQTANGVRVGVTGARSHAFRATEIENALAKSFTPDAAKAVKMPTTGINGDLHGSPEYRAAMISVMASRAVAAALAR